MPKEPQSQRRPADMIGDVVHITKMTTSEIGEISMKRLARHESGLVGAQACIGNTMAEQHKVIAVKAANAGWADGCS